VEEVNCGASKMVTRKPAVAGKFYEGNAEELIKELSLLVKPLPDVEKKKILGGVSPHAGYIYSGHVAGSFIQEYRYLRES